MNVSRVMRKPAFCICENKGADQLCGKLAAFLFNIICSSVQQVDLQDPEDRFSRDEARLPRPICPKT